MKNRILNIIGIAGLIAGVLYGLIFTHHALLIARIVTVAAIVATLVYCAYVYRKDPK